MLSAARLRALAADTRKKTARNEKASSSQKQPPAKKHKKDRTVANTATEIELVQQKLGSYLVHDPVLKVHYLVNTFSGQPLPYHAFPLILEQTEPKKLPKKYTLGAAKISHVFAAIKEAFKELNPDSPEEMVKNWQVWIWNCNYYGVSESKKLVDCAAIARERLCTQPFGGPQKQPCQFAISKEKEYNRFEYAVALEDWPGMKGRKCLSYQELKQDIEESKKMAESDECIEMVKERVNDACNEGESSEDEESGSDNE